MHYVRLDDHDSQEDHVKQHCCSQLPHLKKDDILRWFQQCGDMDAAWVLNRLAKSRPHVLASVVSGNQSESVFYTKRNTSQNRLELSSGAMLGYPVVQFTHSIFYSAEGVDSSAALNVMRIGNTEGTSEVFYETQDKSALSGRSYVATSGKLVFNPGVALLHIKVPIIDNDVFDTTTEFICRLKPEGLKGAVLGSHLDSTRVKIIDNDLFPTNDFRHLEKSRTLSDWQHNVEECDHWALLFGFFRMTSSIQNVWQRTVKYIVVDIIHNLWYLLDLFLNVYILDNVVDATSPESELLLFQNRKQSLFLCAFISIASIGSSHMLDYARLSFSVAGPARRFLQASVLRKFLNYKRQVRAHLPPGDVIMAIERDCDEIVSAGYVNLLKVLTSFGKIACMVAFNLLYPLLSGGRIHYGPLVIMFVLPLVLGLFLHARERSTSKALDQTSNLLRVFTSQLSLTEDNCNLVVDFQLRDHCEHVFLEKLNKYNDARRKAKQINLNNRYFCRWCEKLVVATWLIYGGLQLINGNLTIGLFVANQKLLASLGSSFEALYEIVIGMTKAFPSMSNVTKLLNLPTDVEERRDIFFAQEGFVEKCLCSETHLGLHQMASIDTTPIVLNFKRPFQFETRHHHMLNFKGRIEISQGQLLGFVGPLGCGKATLLRLISGSLLQAGRSLDPPIFVPSHLRVANVEDEPHFFSGTLYENLVFGMHEDHPDASRDRVKAICNLLLQHDVMEDYFDSDEQSWDEVFSIAECKLLTLARALIHNFEVLCVHKPLEHLCPSDGQRVLQIMLDHVESKGLEVTDHPGDGRPRTVLISSSSTAEIRDHAHSVVRVDRFSGIRVLGRYDSMEDELLSEPSSNFCMLGR